MKLIDKDAVLAEIERIKGMYCYDKKTNASFVAETVINSINNAINSLEVKEVDLEKEFEEYVVDNPIGDLVNFNAAMLIAKHFFELGIKASNPLTWEDIRKIDALCCKVDAKYDLEEKEHYEEVLKRFEAQKGS